MDHRRWCVSAAVLLSGMIFGLGAGPSAQAQTQTPPQGAAESTGDSKLEPGVVTGLRASLGKSLEIRQDADIVLDSINTLELGRFRDDDVADTLRHITGVSITRTTGRESQCLGIHGL